MQTLSPSHSARQSDLSSCSGSGKWQTQAAASQHDLSPVSLSPSLSLSLSVSESLSLSLFNMHFLLLGLAIHLTELNLEAMPACGMPAHQ